MPIVEKLTPERMSIARGALDLFARAFEDGETYASRPPSDAYLRRVLTDDALIGLVIREGGRVVAGLIAYELRKLEQERSELYIYDLAVDEAHRRRGLATSLIDALRVEARERGAWVIYVQADTDPEDEPARALYSKLGAREEVLHFDIPVRSAR